MSENETRESTTPEVTPVTSESPVPTKSAKKISVKFYIIAILVVAVGILGVIFQLEKEGRSSTTFFAGYLAEQEANRVVATINGEHIINKDLQTSINQFSQMATAQGVDITTEEAQDEIRSQSLQVLINTELLKQEAEKRGLSVSDEDVEAKINEIKEGLGGEEVLNNRLVELGFGMDKLKADIRDEILIQSLLDQIFEEANIEVTAEEISATYEQAGGAAAGLPALEEVTAQVEAQIRTTKEQSAIDDFLVKLKEGAEIEVVGEGEEEKA